MAEVKKPNTPPASKSKVKVVPEGAREVEVKNAQGKKFTVSVKYYEEHQDTLQLV